MKLRKLKAAWIYMPMTACAIAVVGCGPNEPRATTGSASDPPNSAAAGDHSGWWCIEHGVPELECSMCSTKAAAKCKAMNDWCGEHNRAQSQCFLCEPKRAEKFAALYEAKFGTKPPKPQDNSRDN